MRRVQSTPNSRAFSFMLPYSSVMMFIDFSLESILSQRPVFVTLFRLIGPHSLVSLFQKDDDRTEMDPVQCCFLQICFWPFRSIATTTFDRISPGSKHFVGSGFWPNCLSQCCDRRVSLTVPKHLDSCSTFPKAVVTSGAFPSHSLSWF